MLKKNQFYHFVFDMIVIYYLEYEKNGFEQRGGSNEDRDRPVV